MIGHVQSNKINRLIKKVPNLALVETIDSIKLSDALNTACGKFRPKNSKLGVLVEVATSREESKTGISSDEAEALVDHIIQNCTNLEFKGLMTIAEESRKTECFAQLRYIRHEIQTRFNLGNLTLSMGMSGDWETAVEYGSNQVRIGSAIFGSR